MMIAITRDISPDFTRCALTHREREPIDLALAEQQHHAYRAALARLGCEVVNLPAGEDQPDSVFVEDCAVVVDELAVIARPALTSRRREVGEVARALKSYRRLVFIEPPGTLEGGDVLTVGRRVFVGRSSRTNQAGIDQLGAALEPVDYQVIAVDVDDCLHLKSAISYLGADTLLVNNAWIDVEAFTGLETIDVHGSEPNAANVLHVGEALVFPSAFPRTRERLCAEGFTVVTVDASEVAKAEGGVTCCSLILAS